VAQNIMQPSDLSRQHHKTGWARNERNKDLHKVREAGMRENGVFGKLLMLLGLGAHITVSCFVCGCKGNEVSNGGAIWVCPKCSDLLRK
jgi:hypothetical protein